MFSIKDVLKQDGKEREYVLEFDSKPLRGGRVQWQDANVWYEDVQVLFVIDEKLTHPEGWLEVMKQGQKKWRCKAVRSPFRSQNGKFYIVCVQLVEPVS